MRRDRIVPLASYPHTYYRIRLIADEERITTELWRSWTFGSIGELGYALELLLGAVTVVMGCVGVLLCLMGGNGSLETAFNGREYIAASEDRLLSETAPSGKGGQVTIRIEPEYSRLFRRHRCVVTIREALGDAPEKDREVWYADNDG